MQTARMGITGWHVPRLAIAKNPVTISAVNAQKKIARKAGGDLPVKMVSKVHSISGSY